MHASLNLRGGGVGGPAEERAEGEVLHDGEFGEDLCVVHFDHALVVVSLVSQQMVLHHIWVDG